MDRGFLVFGENARRSSRSRNKMEHGAVAGGLVSSWGSHDCQCGPLTPRILLNVVITGMAVAVTHGIGLLAKTLLGIAV